MAVSGARSLAGVDGSPGRNAVVRVVSVVNALARAEPGGIGVRELAARTRISRSAVHRILAHLAGLGYANLLPSERYEAGPLALAWAAVLSGAHGLEAATRRSLAELVARFDETAHAFAYAPETCDCVVAAGVQTSRPVRYLLEIGSRAPLYAGAGGKAILAFLDRSLLDYLVVERLTPATIVDKDRLRADLDTIVDRGYAVSQGERVEDAFGVAAAVFTGDQVAGSITLTVPRYRFDEASLPEWSAAVVAAAAAATRLLTASAEPDRHPGE